jgi:NitT/TauT family transport system permease protein
MDEARGSTAGAGPVRVPAPARPRGLGYQARVTWTRIGLIVALLAAWEIYGQFFADRAFVRPPSAVLQALFGRILSEARIRDAILLTVVEVGVAYALSVVVGLIAGVLLGWSQLARKTSFPIVLLLYAIPQITLLPLFVLMFGLGPPSKIAFGFSHGVLPIVVSVMAGMQNVEPLFARAARSMGLGRFGLARHVVFPHMVPSFFAGLRLAMTMTLLGVILAELYVSTAGIGYFTQVFAETFDPAPLFALITVLALIAIVLNEIVRIAERRFTRWRT